MSEDDVRLGLRDAVLAEPPLNFDADALVATARRQTTRRRSFIAAGLATVAVAVAAVAVPAALGRTQAPVGDQPVDQPVVTTTTSEPTVSQWPPPDVEPVSYTADELRTRGGKMAGYLRDLLPEVLPSASKIVVAEFGGEATGKFYDGQTSMNTAVTFAVDGARYSIVITTWVPGAAQSPTKLCGAGEDCTWLDSTVVAKTEVLGEANLTTVHDYRDTGAMVSVTSYNYDMTAVSPTFLPASPVTLEQLTAIATDPELGL